MRYATLRCDTMVRETIRIRYGYDATRYDTPVRDNDGSLPPDRVREPIKFKIIIILMTCRRPLLWGCCTSAIMLELGAAAGFVMG